MKTKKLKTKKSALRKSKSKTDKILEVFIASVVLGCVFALVVTLCKLYSSATSSSVLPFVYNTGAMCMAALMLVCLIKCISNWTFNTKFAAFNKGKHDEG